MNWKTLVLGLVLIDFSALSVWAVMEHGYVGWFEWLLSAPGGITVLTDLCLALGLVSIWLIGDARKRGVSAVPYLALTVTLGSVGPLVYLLVRELSSSRSTAPGRPAVAGA